MSIKGQLVPTLFPDDGSAPAPGSFKYYAAKGETAGMHFACPCGCGEILGVSFEPGRWTWDGNREQPTIRPSIEHLDGCRWHGFLTNGEFRSC